MRFVILFLFSQAFAHQHVNVVDEQQIESGCAAVGYTTRVNTAQQNLINSIFALPDHRLHHALWHAVRSNLTHAQISQVARTYGATWSQEHPVCPPPKNNPSSSNYNAAGEDFFFMHHQMVLLLEHTLLGIKGMKCISPWTTIPDPAAWPLTGVAQNAKSDQAYDLLLEWDQRLQDPAWLKTVSLSQLGWALEVTVHNNLHMRYATDRPATRYRSADGQDGAVVPLNGKFSSSWHYNELGYNWLADPYGSAINPYFWKIHGYVDHLLNAWLTANGKTRAAIDCGTDSKCYTWKGTWVGEAPELSDDKALTATRATLSSRDFNRRRLANQRLGMIRDSDFRKRGAPRLSGLEMLEVARQIVCP